MAGSRTRRDQPVNPDCGSDEMTALPLAQAGHGRDHGGARVVGVAKEGKAERGFD
jgi:hypothetical protein